MNEKVRGQSKEIASQLRRKVEKEKQRQLDVVNKIKRNELLKWRQQQIAQAKGDFKTCLYQVGAAHMAAERETDKMREIDAQRIRNRKLATQRGRLAAKKVKAKKTANEKTHVKESQVHTVATQVDDEWLCDESDDDATLTSSASESSVCSIVARKDTKIISPKKHDAFGQSTSKDNDYVAEKFISISSSTLTDISLGVESPPVTNFTRVSDLLKKSSTVTAHAPAETAAKSETLVTRPYVSKTYKLDTRSVEPPRSPPKKMTVKALASKAAKTCSTHPARASTHPLKKAPIASRAPSAKYVIKPYVPQFIKSKPASTAATRSATDAAKVPPKVQFYDHLNRFSREYPGRLDLIESHDAPPPRNAMEEAKLERERERINLLEMAKAR